MAKRNKRKRERARAEVPPDTEVKVRFTRAGDGKLRVEGLDPANEKLVRKLTGRSGELTIDENAIQLVNEETGQPVKLEASGAMNASFALPSESVLRETDPTLRLLNAKAKRLGSIDELSDEAKWGLGFANARAIGFTEQTGAVDTYLRCVRALLDGASGSVRDYSGGDRTEEGVRMSRQLWARMSSARVFEFPDTHYVALHKSCDRVVTENGKAFDLKTPADLVRMANETLGFLRDPLPFESIYLGFGGGVPLPPELVMTRFEGDDYPEGLTQFRVLGYLVVDSGSQLVVEMSYVITPNDNCLKPTIVYDSEDGRGWKGALTLAPWIVGASVRLINEHKVLVEEKRLGLGQRIEADRIRKKYKQRGVFIPKPYYRLVLKDATIEDAGKRKDALGPPRELSFRHDREGHDRYYVRRGPLPMDPKKQAKLEKAGYRIWLLDRPGADVLEQLARRGMPPKRSDEWMAVLVRRIAEQVIGDPKLPYVPALRVPKVLEGPAGKLTGAEGS